MPTGCQRLTPGGVSGIFPSMDPHDIDSLEAGNLRIAISREGAEMVSLECRNESGTWTKFLYRDGQTEKPASGWANHATVMGYFLHRLLAEQSLYRGHLIRGGNHGFIRHFHFAEPERGPASLTYRIPASSIPHDAYPLRVGLALTYEFTGNELRIRFLFTNEEPDCDAHLSFGVHPGFAVSSPLTCGVYLPPGRYVRHFAPGNFLDGRTESLDWPGGPMPFPRADLPGSFLIELADVPDPVITLTDGGRQVALNFAGVPYMTIWSDMGPFICIEPCWGLPDSNPQKPFEEKTGIQHIPPGGRLEASFGIRPTS